MAEPLILDPNEPSGFRPARVRSSKVAEPLILDYDEPDGYRVMSPRNESPEATMFSSEHVRSPDLIPIFLSFSKTIFPAQQEFIDDLSEGLRWSKMTPRTLGVTEYDTGVPLVAIKNLMVRSAGLISVAFRRTHVTEAEKYDKSGGRAEGQEQIKDKWLTTPWPHVEVGMAFQIDLPILILRESGVIADGILERGSSAFYLPTFDLDSNSGSYLASAEWQHIFHKWSVQVRQKIRNSPYPILPDEPPMPWPRRPSNLPLPSRPTRHRSLYYDERSGAQTWRTSEVSRSYSTPDKLHERRSPGQDEHESSATSGGKAGSPMSIVISQPHSRSRLSGQQYHATPLSRRRRSTSTTRPRLHTVSSTQESMTDNYGREIGTRYLTDDEHDRDTLSALLGLYGGSQASR